MSRGPVPERRADAGMTLIELLVAMALLGLLSTLLIGIALSTQAITKNVSAHATVSEEARTAMERLVRELRQATVVDSVTLPATPSGGLTKITFWSDFNGDGVRSTTEDDPEVLTYCWQPGTEELTLDDDTNCTDAHPVLAATVTGFDLELASSEWVYDGKDGSAKDGITTWRELDKSVVGNNNGKPDGAELQHVDLVGVTLTVRDQNGTQDYHTQVDLRNRS